MIDLSFLEDKSYDPLTTNAPLAPIEPKSWSDFVLRLLFKVSNVYLQYGHRSRTHTPSNPTWLKGAAKLLESGTFEDDWRAVGKILGYKDAK